MSKFEEVRKNLIALTKEKISKEFSRKDLQLIKIINTIDYLDKVINIMIEKLREWYMLYNPEEEYKTSNHDILLEKIIQKKEKRSYGGIFDNEQLNLLREFALRIKHIKDLREKLEKKVESLAVEICPNASKIAPPILVARYLEKAGGLDKLARMPASTIQVLGAEKTLFIHLSKGIPPPKHGILFQHPLVRNSPKKMRGKISRFLANKLAIAFREDYFGRDLTVGEKLKEEVEQKYEELKNKFMK